MHSRKDANYIETFHTAFLELEKDAVNDVCNTVAM